MNVALGLAVAVLVAHPLRWSVGGRQTLGAGWWAMSAVAWWTAGGALWATGEPVAGWGSLAVGVLCIGEAGYRAREAAGG